MFHPQTAMPVLAIHGSASSAKQWRSLQEAAGPSFFVTAPSLPESDATSRLDVMRAALGSHPMRVPVHLIAHSFGSSVAMRLANAAPERVASVTLYDPVVAVSSAAGLGLPPALMVLSEAMRAAAPAQAMQRFIDFWAGEGAWAATPDWRREALAWKHPSVLRDFQQLLSGDWTPDRIAYRGPLTVLRGGKSPSVIRATTDHLVRTYPCVSCHVMPGLDHMTPLAQPQITDNLFLKCVIAQAQQIKPALAA